MTKTLVLFAAAASAFAMTLAYAPAGGGKRSDAVVKVTARMDKAIEGKSVVVLDLDIAPGWHLYANPVDNEDLVGSQVVVKAIGTNAAIDYPAGKEKDDKILGKYRIYEDKIIIRAAVDREVTPANPLELTVKVQACDKNSCLQPATVKLSVPK